MRRSGAIAVLLGVALASGTAGAAPGCRIFTVTPLAFGNYDVYATAPLDSTATLIYRCPRSTRPVVDISAGNAGSFAPRAMAGPGGDELQYNVYVDAARMRVWDDTPVPLPNGTQAISLYGRIYAQQDVSVGTYSDTLVVTFNF